MLHKEIIVNKPTETSPTTENSPISENELNDIIVGAVGTMSIEDKPNLVYLLQRSGSLVTDVNTQSEILDASFKAIRDSKSFRDDLADYLVSQGDIIDLSDSENNFANGDGLNKIGSWFKTAGKNVGQGLKKVGSTIFTKENTQALVGAGIGILSTKLQNQANKGAGQQAIEYTNAQSQLEAIKLAQLQASQGSGGGGGNFPTEETKKKGWVLPVAIGGGVLVLGTILYFVFRKK
jgi:hypothetical protein